MVYFVSTEQYDLQKERCCTDGPVTFQKMSERCCGAKLYDTDIKGCCGTKTFNPLTEICCQPGTSISFVIHTDKNSMYGKSHIIHVYISYLLKFLITRRMKIESTKMGGVPLNKILINPDNVDEF